MGKINRIELLVHPFFTYYLKSTEEARKDAGTFMELWKGCIGQISKDGSSILIFVSNLLREKDYLRIREGVPVPDESYEAVLVKYACNSLDGRLFFVEDRVRDGNLPVLKEMLAKEVTVYVYGEWTSACCMDNAETLAKGLGIPKSRFRFMPKRSIDVRDGYPDEGELRELMRLPEGERVPAILKRLERLDAAVGYPSPRELQLILKLPKKERLAVLRFVMRLYTRLLEDFREGR